MAKNKLSDLNEFLFSQIEKISDRNLKNDELELEFKRAESLSKLSSQVIGAHKVVLDAAKLIASGNVRNDEILETFGIERPIKPNPELLEQKQKGTYKFGQDY